MMALPTTVKRAGYVQPVVAPLATTGKRAGYVPPVQTFSPYGPPNPLTTSTLQYNPATAQQYRPGDVIPGTITEGAGKYKFFTPPIIAGADATLKSGWAPRIGHITTQAATAKKRLNPLVAAPTETAKRKNPFVISQTPGADLFGLNIPV